MNDKCTPHKTIDPTKGTAYIVVFPVGKNSKNDAYLQSKNQDKVSCSLCSVVCWISENSKALRRAYTEERCPIVCVDCVQKDPIKFNPLNFVQTPEAAIERQKMVDALRRKS